MPGAFGALDEPNEEENERPTVVPPFDVEEMARRTHAPVNAEPRADEEIPTVIPPAGPALSARDAAHIGEAAFEVGRRASARRSSLPPSLDPHLSMHPPRREHPGEDPVVEVAEDEALDPLDEARMLLDEGDEAGALAIVEALLRRTPSSAPARRIAEECEHALTAKYAAELGSLAGVPRLAISIDQLVSLSLDHRAGFLLSFVDGASTLATIVDMSGMPPSEVLRSFLQLRERRIITLR